MNIFRTDIVHNTSACLCLCHCISSVHIRSFSGLYFPAFGQNTEIYSVNIRIQSEYGKEKKKKRIWENTEQEDSEFGHLRNILHPSELKHYVWFQVVWISQ